MLDAAASDGSDAIASAMGSIRGPWAFVFWEVRSAECAVLDDVVYRGVMSCHVMSCHVMSCHVMSCHVMSCHVMSCHVMSCHVMSCVMCHVGRRLLQRVVVLSVVLQASSSTLWFGRDRVGRRSLLVHEQSPECRFFGLTSALMDPAGASPHVDTLLCLQRYKRARVSLSLSPCVWSLCGRELRCRVGLGVGDVNG